VSGNHKRKARKMKRDWRYAAGYKLMAALYLFDIMRASKRHKDGIVVRDIWDFIYRWERR
jgi:hypothetical protein